MKLHVTLIIIVMSSPERKPIQLYVQVSLKVRLHCETIMLNKQDLNII